MGRQEKNSKSDLYRINEEITFKGNVRIVGDNIESSIVRIDEARKIAYDMGLDLIDLNVPSNIPVMKIGNYEKMMYEFKKAQKKNKKSPQQVKEIQLSVNIASNDLKTKVNKAKSFIENGHKVKVVLTMKGREMARKEENKRSLLEFIVSLEDVASIENNLVENGNKTIVILKRKS